MNITFLIGNGFDISLGLKTSYSEFAKYYIQRPSSHPSIVELKKDIEKDIHNGEKEWGSKWADFERAFGLYTTHISNDDEFDIVYDDVVEELRTYLSMVNKSFNAMLTSNTLNQKIFVESLIHPYDFIRNSKILSNFIQEEINRPINIHIINFNYTSTIDTLVKNIPWDSSEYKRMHISIKEDVYHIHGTLDSTILFGVNDTSQIANKTFLTNSKVPYELVKPTFNERLGYGIDDKCVSAIKSAHIVCVFGMSLGETDKYWWEEIGKSIQSPDQFAIFFMYDNNKKYELTQERLKLREEDRLKTEVVLPKIGCNMDSSIIDRIYIGYNTDLFQGIMKAKEN